jgi:hypothetical protein
MCRIPPFEGMRGCHRPDITWALAGQEVALGCGRCKRCRRFVTLSGFVVAEQASEQVGAGGVEQEVAGEMEPIDQVQGVRGGGRVLRGRWPGSGQAPESLRS